MKMQMEVCNWNRNSQQNSEIKSGCSLFFIPILKCITLFPAWNSDSAHVNRVVFQQPTDLRYTHAVFYFMNRIMWTNATPDSNAAVAAFSVVRICHVVTSIQINSYFIQFRRRQSSSPSLYRFLILCIRFTKSH